MHEKSFPIRKFKQLKEILSTTQTHEKGINLINKQRNIIRATHQFGKK